MQFLNEEESLVTAMEWGIRSVPLDLPARADEIPVTAAGSTAETTSAWLLANHAQLGYIPDEISLDVVCPLVAEELAELVTLLRTMTLDQARDELLSLPNPDELPDSLTFRDLV